MEPIHKSFACFGFFLSYQGFVPIILLSSSFFVSHSVYGCTISESFWIGLAFCQELENLRLRETMEARPRLELSPSLLSPAILSTSLSTSAGIKSEGSQADQSWSLGSTQEHSIKEGANLQSTISRVWHSFCNQSSLCKFCDSFARSFAQILLFAADTFLRSIALSSTKLQKTVAAWLGMQIGIEYRSWEYSKVA